MIKEFEDIDLTGRNSFHVAQSAKKLIEFDSADDLKNIFGTNAPQMWTVLSGGNNILFTKDFDGTLLTPVSDKIKVMSETDDSVVVRADAGVEWDDLAEWAAGHGLWGIENLSLIPGKAGAAPVQNIGAYGCEAKDVIETVEMFCPETANTLILSNEHCKFGYRDSIFKHELKGRVIISSVTVRLSKKPQPNLGYGDLLHETEVRGGATLRNIRDAVCSIRRSKLPDPEITGNAGSFFKNPVVDTGFAAKLKAKYPDMPTYATPDGGGVKLAAGWLIDMSGLKGAKDGHVGIHEKQALVIINLGGATGDEVVTFARKVQHTVRDRFGVDIDTEVNIL